MIRLQSLTFALTTLAGAAAHAHTPVPAVTITSHYDNAVGTSDAAWT